MAVLYDNVPPKIEEQLLLEELHPRTFLELCEKERKKVTHEMLSEILGCSPNSITHWIRYPTTHRPPPLWVKKSLFYYYSVGQEKKKIESLVNTLLNK